MTHKVLQNHKSKADIIHELLKAMYCFICHHNSFMTIRDLEYAAVHRVSQVIIQSFSGGSRVTASNFIQKRLLTRCFLVNFRKSFRTGYSKDTSYRKDR